MPEFTSSGMTHVVGTWLPTWIPGTMEWHQDPIYTIDPLMEHINYGEVEIDTENRTATFIIRDMAKNGYLNATFDLDSGMQFKSEKLLRNAKLCESVQKDKQYLMFIIMTLKAILNHFLEHYRGVSIWPYSWSFFNSDRIWWIFVW
tara:strand:- start:148 stop:585 length:438 start_codon:yes stop_codon:yes gene_type:complete